ncbi:MAG TPA: DUF4105 domain-containing protein, partial [Cyclobacteriaceae bacterium]|nr:DUF4105 domain-containing protein [Cyclobacteriaceae bacterium]
KFIRGKLLYYLSAYDFGRMHNEYIYLNQSLFEQVLNLSADEKEEVFEFLLRNYEPENRSYLYDFYFDNCSSRIRDVFQDILGDKLKFRYEHITEQKSFRQLTDEQLGKAPWGRFGIDLALGMPADKIAAPWDRMFLPYEMMYCFEQAVITADSTEELFASPVSAVHTAKPFDEPIAFFTPGRVFWLIFMLVFLLTIFQVYQNTNIKHLDTAIFTVLGLAGCFILFLWLGTDHRVTKMNLNILWAFPADLILIYFLLMKSRSPWLKYLLVLKIGMNILILAGWNFLPQSFHAAIIPLILINISRGGHLYWLSLRSRFNVEPKS